CVTTDTNGIPLFGMRLSIGVADERIVAQNPPFLLDQPGKRETDLAVPVSRRDPEHLEVMRPGDHFHRNPIRNRWRSVGELRSLQLFDTLNVDPITIQRLMQGKSGAT